MTIPNDDLNIFPIVKTEQDKEHVLKWKVNTSNYEIHIGQLDSIATADVLQHATTVLHRIQNTVTTVAHVGLSLFKVFP
jgi:hypothetical protein